MRNDCWLRGGLAWDRWHRAVRHQSARAERPWRWAAWANDLVPLPFLNVLWAVLRWIGLTLLAVDRIVTVTFSHAVKKYWRTAYLKPTKHGWCLRVKR